MLLSFLVSVFQLSLSVKLMLFLTATIVASIPRLWDCETSKKKLEILLV